MNAWTPYETVAPQMRSLLRLDASLQRLDIRWEVIDTTAQIVCPTQAADFLQTLDKTRAAFGTLTREMVEHIAATHLHNCLDDLAARAQVTIDILVRNLFERTADVGFIATDAALVAFVHAGTAAAAPRPDTAQADILRERLQAYRAKYTVYDDILVLDAHAQPLLSLRQGPPCAPTTDGTDPAARPAPAPPWWRQLMGQSGHIEHYGLSAWFPDDGPQLLYAHRIVSPQGQACGAVVLRFDLASELPTVFADALGSQARTVLALVDAQGTVLASSQPAALAVGETMPLADSDIHAHGPAAPTVPIQGHEYLMARRITRGYQGYHGLPWQAVALVRLDSAFRDSPAARSAATEPMATDLDADLQADDPMLDDIIERARAIEEGLTRVIWNGKLADTNASTGSSVHAVFDQIGRTGKDTVALFDQAIAELRKLLLAGRRAELSAHARLAASIMDRNLYERANDCRWWALSQELIDSLQAMQGGLETAAAETARQQATAILAHLNRLYTVYRRIALFDRNGRIVAVSCDIDSVESPLQLDHTLVRRTLALKGHQAYAVSPLEPQALADGQPAYLYCAALRSSPSTPALGGIALAFNCQTELQAMLQDALPPGGQAQGLFLDPQGRVLAAANAQVAVGDRLEWVAALARHATPPERGHRVRWQGRDFLAGIAYSRGYREFKREDGYREPVLSVMLMPVDTLPARNRAPALASVLPALPSAAMRRYGVVQCGSLLLAIESRHVQQAMSAQRMLNIPGNGQWAGMLEVTHAGMTSMATAYDACRLVGQPALPDPRQAVAVVVHNRQRVVVLLVNQLLGVVTFDTVHPAPANITASAPWITGILTDAAGKALVYVVNPERFDARLMPLPQEMLAPPPAQRTQDDALRT